jgi:hypothetical protein
MRVIDDDPRTFCEMIMAAAAGVAFQFRDYRQGCAIDELIPTLRLAFTQRWSKAGDIALGRSRELWAASVRSASRLSRGRRKYQLARLSAKPRHDVDWHELIEVPGASRRRHNQLVLCLALMSEIEKGETPATRSVRNVIALESFQTATRQKEAGQFSETQAAVNGLLKFECRHIINGLCPDAKNLEILSCFLGGVHTNLVERLLKPAQLDKIVNDLHAACLSLNGMGLMSSDLNFILRQAESMKTRRQSPSPCKHATEPGIRVKIVGRGKSRFL